MRYTARRTYPVTYRKKNTEPEKFMDFSLATAATVLAFTFVSGFFWGFITKKAYR